MRTVRTALLAPSSARRVVVAVLAAAAVIIGLLAMHTLNMHSADGVGATVAATGPSHPATHMEVAADSACGDTCPDHAPMHDMTTMTSCVLALLLLLLILGLPAVLRLQPAAADPAPKHRLLATATLPRPPSLLVLSISRT